MGVECLDSPDAPSVAVVFQCLFRDGNGLGSAGCSRRQGEHQDSSPRAEKRLSVPLPDPLDIWLVAIVTADGDMAAKVVRGPDFAKMMVPAELAVGVAGDQVKQHLTLDRLGAQRLVKES